MKVVFILTTGLICGWIRSVAYEDLVGVTGSGVLVLVASISGTLEWSFIGRVPYRAGVIGESIDLSTEQRDIATQCDEQLPIIYVEWAGIALLRGTSRQIGTVCKVVVPYWMLILGNALIAFAFVVRDIKKGRGDPKGTPKGP